MKIAEMIQKHLASASEEMDRADFEFLASCGETRSVERKSIQLLSSGDVNKTLSKAASAFSNYDGGFVLLGVDDDGNLQTGVEDHHKNTTIRDWLVAIVDGNTTPRVTAFAVKRVEVNGKYLFAAVIGESEAAPHQALDHRYYGRIDGQSKPIDGLMVKDIFSRQRNAVLEPFIKQPERDYNQMWAIRLGVVNISQQCADDVLLLGNLEFNGNLSGHFSGGGSFVKPTGQNKAVVQLPFNLVYPGVPQIEQPVRFSNLISLRWTVDIVARNFPKKAFVLEITWDGKKFIPALTRLKQPRR